MLPRLSGLIGASSWTASGCGAIVTWPRSTMPATAAVTWPKSSESVGAAMTWPRSSGTPLKSCAAIGSLVVAAGVKV